MSDDAQTPRLLLLDGHSLAYRAYFALPVENFSTQTGQHTDDHAEHNADHHQNDVLRLQHDREAVHQIADIIKHFGIP